MKEYYKENLETDVDWLVGYDIDCKEATDFIMSLLDRKNMLCE